MKRQDKNIFINPKKYDFSFRPESYFDVGDPIQELLTNIKGENRRKSLKALLDSGDIDFIPDFLMRESLKSSERALLGSLDPTHLGGEFLPERQENEVEIARIVLDSVTQDVISLRAKKNPKLISYRLVDEYDFQYSFSPIRTKEPLSFGQLIKLFSNATEGQHEWVGIPNFFREFIEFSRYTTLDEVKEWEGFVTFESEFYPKLNSYYQDEAKLWSRSLVKKFEQYRRSDEIVCWL